MTKSNPDSTDLKWPDGSYHWDEVTRSRLPYLRGIHLPPVHDNNDLLNSKIEFAEDGGYYDFKSILKNIAEPLGTDWILWTTSTARQRTTREALESATEDEWLEILGQSQIWGNAICGEETIPVSDWAVYTCAVQLGILKTLAMALKIVDALPENSLIRRAGGGNALAYPLNLVIARLNESEHAQVIAYLDNNANGDRKMRCFRMQCCPHHTQYATDMVEDFASTRLDTNTILQTALPSTSTALELARAIDNYITVPSVLLQIFLHGEEAYELLWYACDRAAGYKQLEVELIDCIVQTTSKQGLIRLVENFDKPTWKAAVVKLSQTYPAAVLKCMMERVNKNRSSVEQSWTMRLAIAHPDDFNIALNHVNEKTLEFFNSKITALTTEESPADEVPELLTSPPWEKRESATEIPIIKLRQIELHDTINFTDKTTRQALLDYAPVNLRYVQDENSTHQLFEFLRIDADNVAELVAGSTIDPRKSNAFKNRYGGHITDDILVLPDELSIALSNSAPGAFWHGCNKQYWHVMFARHSEKVLPGFIACVKSNSEDGFIVALPVASGKIATLAIHALLRGKKIVQPAKTYITAHPHTTLIAAMPLAFGKAGKARDAAHTAIRWMVDEGHLPLAQSVAAQYGAEAEEALATLLDADPLMVLPARIPKLPTFFNASAMQRPVLRCNNKGLPTTAVEHIGTMLALSTPDERYAGIDQIKTLCTSESLASFAWDLFNSWAAAGAPAKEAWAFNALGWFGNDTTANDLTPLIRQWPGESQHQRAVKGLDVLAQIGSDTALMHLNAIANKVKFKGLREKAKEKILEIAETRGLTAEQLGDRLVPDLDLNQNGRLTLDFGNRQFQIGFDESLKTVVFNAEGTRLKSLPKPGKKDDEALAKKASSQFSQLKKDAKLAASIQLLRMEQAMSSQRRWPFSECREFYISHPLIQHLATRVVWGVYDNNKLVNAFRVAEDQSLADSNDETVELADDASVGLAHPLELHGDMLTSFGELFADYEILQPFEQLSRETYAFTDAEKKKSALPKFANKPVSSGSIMGLANKGWERGEPQDAGGVNWYLKRVGALVIEIQLDPGIVIGMPTEFPVQSIPEIVLHHSDNAQAGRWGNKESRVAFSELDPISASEVIRDLHLLAPAKPQ